MKNDGFVVVLAKTSIHLQKAQSDFKLPPVFITMFGRCWSEVRLHRRA